MNSLFSARLLRLLTTLIPLAILVGCGKGEGPRSIQNEPAAPFDGFPDSCFEALTFEDICDQKIDFIEFEGAPGQIVDNPDQGGINPSAKVVEIRKLRAASGATFGGTIVEFSAVVPPAGLDIPAGSFFTVKVWSQRPVNVLFEPEGGGAGSGDEVRHGGTGWEELTFNVNFSGTTTGFVFIFDNGTNGDAGSDPDNWTFYIDDISAPMGGGGGGPATTLPVDFEGDPASYDFGPDGGFEGGAASVIANPDMSGINTSAQVGQMQKFPGAVFGGATLAIEPTTVEAGSSFTMKVWSQRPVPVLLQPEPQGPGSGIEVAHGGTGWEELTFSLPGLSGTVSGLTLIFDNGTAGAADTDPTTWTFYFDDITLVPPGGGGGAATTLPVDFEGDPASYDFGPDGGFEGGAASVIANPDSSGINTSAQVGQMQKFPGAVFGGATLVIEPTTVESGSSFTMKVWSQRTVPVLLQPEPAGPPSAVEVVHGGTGWEELTFDLGAFADTVNGLTLIFQNGTAGAADTDPTNWTFYFDDITLVPPGSGGAELLTNGDMEAGQAPWIGQATVVDDGGNFVLQGLVTNPDPGQPFLVNASQVVALTQDETYTLTFRAKASVPRTMFAGIGLNVAPFTNVVETVPLTTDWQAYTYTLTSTGFGGAESRILFDMNAEAGNVFIDDVSLTVGSLLTNGNMEAGQDPWINQATVVDDGGNLVLRGVVTNPDPGQPFLVNASQVVSLVADEQYVLTFKAKATVDRGMIAGIGLNVAPFTNMADTVALTTGWETYTCTLMSTGFGGDDSRVLFDMNAEAGDVSIDDVALALLGPTGSDTLEGCAGGAGGGSGTGELLINGDMEAGQAPWIGQATVVDDGGNFVLQGLVTNPDPGQPFLVNGSQVVTLTQDETYTLTFRAKASVPRTMLAGIGLNVAPFTNVVETVPLTTDWQAYTYTLTATGFGGADSRVLFDMNAEAGDVFIDDVSLVVGSLLTNGDMEAGQAPWIGQAAVVDDGGNMVLQGVVTNPDPGQPFLVNASQVVTLTADETYVLTFKAKASVARTMLAGLGLNVAPFTNVVETVPLTTDWQTFTYTITTTGFGGADSRVLFDMNAEAGDVFIDDVALAVLGPIGGSGSGAGGNIAINGGFETGDFTGWTQFPQTGTQTIVTTNPSEGTYTLNLGIPARMPGDPGVDNVIKNANLQAGSLTPNAPITVTWDMRGSLVGAGGVVFVELFSEFSGGGATGEIYTGGPISPDADPNVWTSYTWNTNLGGDVGGGVSLQLKVGCGGVEGCGADIFFDNVTITIN